MKQAVAAHREIALVLLVFVGLGVLYSTATPLFEAPDELWHFAYVQYLAQGNGLPVQTLDKPAHLARQEGSQPPLYYLLAAGATFWIDTSDYPGIVWENPHYGYAVPGIVNDNKNLFIHTSYETWPYRGAVLAIHIARLLSVLMGALAVLFAYRLTLEFFPTKKFLAASAGAVAGFVPQFVFISSAVSNDSTIVAAAALGMWLVVRLFTRSGPRRLSEDIVLGAAAGLAALAKVSGAGLAVLAAIALIYIFRRDRRQLVLHLLVFGGTVAAVAGWWYARNWVLYGELTGTVRMTQIFGARIAPLTLPQLVAQLNEVWETFWVGFGWGNVRAQPIVYEIIKLLVAFSALGLLVGLYRRRQYLWETLIRARPLLLLVLWSGIAFAELITWMEMTQAPHGRLLFPILPAVAPLIVLGLVQWFPGGIQPVIARLPALGLAVFAALAPFTLLLPAYAYPVPLAANDVPATANRADVNYGNRLKLLAYSISQRRVIPGESLQLTLYWQSLAPMDDNYSIGIHVLDTNQKVVGARDSYPGRGLLPTTLMYPGQVIRDEYWVPVAADSAPGIARIQIDLYSRETKTNLPAHDPLGQAITPVVGPFLIAALDSASPQPQNPTRLVFGKQIELIGYDAPNPGKGSQAPEQYALTLYWKRVGPISKDYTVFIHLLDDEGRIVAQQDRAPVNGAYQTSFWENGEVVADQYALASSRQASRIELGLYSPDTGERLLVEGDNGESLGDHVDLQVPGVGQ